MKTYLILENYNDYPECGGGLYSHFFDTLKECEDFINENISDKRTFSCYKISAELKIEKAEKVIRYEIKGG